MDTVERLKDIFVATGAGWVLWLLFALSVGSVAVSVERWFVFRTKRGELGRLVASLDAHLSLGNFGAALEELRGQVSVGAAVAAAGLKLAGRGVQAAERGMQSAMALERERLEVRLAFLGTLGNNAPFIGLFGTVIGVILAFEELSIANAASGSGTSQAASDAVMGAIAEALVATAVGIAVALPAVALYNVFMRRIDTILAEADALSNLVLAYLVAEPVRDEPAHPEPRPQELGTAE
ncbi:MAG: MotA/TolQ/ExbB proton channel family protein [Myxococcota bacterium]